MNKKDGNNKREGARSNSARPSSKKPTPGGMPKRAQSPKKTKPKTFNTKVALRLKQIKETLLLKKNNS